MGFIPGAMGNFGESFFPGQTKSSQPKQFDNALPLPWSSKDYEDCADGRVEDFQYGDDGSQRLLDF